MVMNEKHILVMTLHKPDEFQFEEWVSGLNFPCKISLVLDADSADKKKMSVLKDNPIFNFVAAYDNYLNNGNVYTDLFSLHQSKPITHIIAFGEDDVIRAARLREMWGLNGQSIENAVYFRDKSLMRKKILQSGLATHIGQPLEGPLCLIEFVKKHGLPVYVKPRSSSGSVYGKKISTEVELSAFLGNGFQPRIPYSEYVSDLCVEVFQPGNLYHVDGIAINNHIAFSWVFKYVTSGLQINTFSDEVVVGSHMLSDVDPLFELIKQYINNVCEQLRLPSGYAFHAEVFVDQNDNISLCEIASRTGGGRINDALMISGGPNLNKLQFLLQSEVISDSDGLNYLQQHFPEKLCGWLLLPPQSGVCKNIPNFSIDGVEKSKVTVKPGDAGWKRSFSGDSMGYVVLSGENGVAIVNRMQNAVSHILENFQFCTD